MDQPYIKHCTALAQEFDVDAFHLSHRLVHDAEDVIGHPEHRTEILKPMKTMNDAGLEIWCWTHEIKKLPPGIKKGNFNLSDPILKQFLRDKYDNFVTQVLPGLDGIILTLAETGVKVYQNVTAEEARRNVSDLVGVLHEPLSRHKVRLAVRSFVYKKAELDIVEVATQDMPMDVAVMSKIYPHDWQPFYPINPIIGAVDQREQWVEFDLGFEFEGQNTLPYSDPHQCIRQLKHLWDKGLKALRMNAELYAASKKAYFALRLHQHLPEAISKDKVAAFIDEFDRVVKRLHPLPEHAWCRKYRPGSTLPKAVSSLRKELAKTSAVEKSRVSPPQVQLYRAASTARQSQSS